MRKEIQEVHNTVAIKLLYHWPFVLENKSERKKRKYTFSLSVSLSLIALFSITQQLKLK